MKVRYQLESDQSVIEEREERGLPHQNGSIRLSKGQFTIIDVDIEFEEGQEIAVAHVRPSKPAPGGARVV